MNLNQTFSILFWLNRSKANNKALVPIWARITIDGKRAECSIKKQISSALWDADNNRAKGNSEEARAINNYLVIVQAELTKHYNILLSTKDFVTAGDVRNSYKGIKEEKKTFLQLFTLYNQKLSERKEIEDLSDGRYKRFKILYNKCAEFIKYKFKKSDVALDEVKLNFIVEFEHYLRTIKKIGYNTAMKYMKDLKQVTKYGVMLEYIPSNPFDNFKCSYKKVKRDFLDHEELELLYKKEFKIKRLEEVRDCYIFSCYTGTPIRMPRPLQRMT